MRNVTGLLLLLLLLLLSTGLPRSAFGQDADAAFYEAATAWANLVMVEEDFQAAAAQADPAVAGQLTAAVLEDAWVQLHVQLGDLRSLAPKAQQTEQGYHIVSLAGDFDAGLFDVQVVMNDDHGVAGFFLLPPR